MNYWRRQRFWPSMHYTFSVKEVTVNMSKVEEKVLSYINQEELLQLTMTLVGFATENPPADYSAISRFIFEEYSKLNMDVHLVEGQEGKPNVLARWQGKGVSQESLLLSGHMDVVPAGSGWVHDPFKATIEGNKLWGRGTADMKGAIAAQIIAVKALRQAGVDLKGDLYLGATVDDETAGSMGLRYVINEGWARLGWPRPTFHILGEPSNLQLYIAFKGRMWVKITLEGRSAHGGNPSAGINAIVKMTSLIDAILKLERLSHPLMGVDTINIGTIQGGEKTNIVPDACTITVDYRYVSPQNPEVIEKRLRDVIQNLADQDPQFKLKEFEIFENRSPREISSDNHYIQNLKRITERITGKESRFGGVLSAGDAYWTLSAGIPAVFYGPGSLSVAHTNAEYLPIDELVAAAKIFALYVLQILG